MNRRLSLRIRYERRSGLVGLLALALLVAVFGGYLAWGQAEVAASGSQAPLDHARDKPLASSAGMRGYYLTTTPHNGASTLTACADGYHFASLWEIMEPSNLKYNTALGMTKADSGQGPPTGPPLDSLSVGWVRTGYSGSTASGTAGQDNCDAWASTSGSGTIAGLPNNWTAGQDIHVWDVRIWSCGAGWAVWCVADDVASSPGSGPVYLPIVVKND